MVRIGNTFYLLTDFFMIPTHIFCHHSAISYSKNPDQANATNNYHKAKWGIQSSLGFFAGYNAEVAKNGRLTTFRADGERTVAQYVAKANNVFKNEDLNDGMALSICFDGNFDIEEPTDEQCTAALRWIKEKMAKYGIPAGNVHLHRLVSPKSCAGKRIPEGILNYLEQRANVIPEWAESSVEKAKKKGITNWDHPNMDVDSTTLEYILHDLSLVKELRGDCSKVRLIKALDNAGLLD